MPPLDPLPLPGSLLTPKEREAVVRAHLQRARFLVGIRLHAEDAEVLPASMSHLKGSAAAPWLLESLQTVLQLYDHAVMVRIASDLCDEQMRAEHQQLAATLTRVDAPHTVDEASSLVERAATSLRRLHAEAQVAAQDRADAARWRAYAASPHTALHFGTTLDPTDPTVDWPAECARLADATLARIADTTTSGA